MFAVLLLGMTLIALAVLVVSCSWLFAWTKDGNVLENHSYHSHSQEGGVIYLYCVWSLIKDLFKQVLSLSQVTIGKISAGHVINLSSNDVHRFDLVSISQLCMFVIKIKPYI